MKLMTIISRITTTEMSKSEKLYSCWRYLTSSGNFYYSTYWPDLNKKGWQREVAYNMLTTGGGDCYGFACTFAAMARELGYNPYVVLGRVSGTRDGAADGLTRHGWVMIDGAYYDPEAQFAGWYLSLIHIYLKNAVETLKKHLPGAPQKLNISAA